MIKYKALLYKISTRTNELPVTYRWFMVCMFVAMVYGVNLILSDVLDLNSIVEVQKQEANSIKNTEQFKKDLNTLKELANQPEKSKLESEIKAVNEKIIEVDDDIEFITRLLIDPKTMTQLLDSIVQKQNKLKLMSLKSIDHVKQETLGLYQHQIEITLQGNYLEIASYLHELESMPFKVYWKKIDYKSLNEQGQNPNAMVVLTIYTLSREGGWLGV